MVSEALKVKKKEAKVLIPSRGATTEFDFKKGKRCQPSPSCEAKPCRKCRYNVDKARLASEAAQVVDPLKAAEGGG